MVLGVDRAVNLGIIFSTYIHEEMAIEDAKVHESRDRVIII